MAKIGEGLKINKKTAKNRILMPALVCFNWSDEHGYQTVDRIEHYGRRAEGGTGTIVIEATAVSKDGRITEKQLGLWNDGHIDQFRKIADACHKENCLVLVQLVHAGRKEPSNKHCAGLSIEEIAEIKIDFLQAAIRAQKSGLDGVEIHGAHGFLLNQFASKKSNSRTDEYGGDLNSRIRLPIEIVRDIRKNTGNDFLISYRFGVNDPTFIEDIYFAKQLESCGTDLLDVSAGIGYDGVKPPEDFEFSAITYMGKVIHDNVNIPVASVYGIRYPEQANKLLENNYTDLVAVGRGILADPDWTNKALNGEKVNHCLYCEPWCKYGKDGRTCPRRTDN
jgi:NADPH2 dehydrogenase